MTSRNRADHVAKALEGIPGVSNVVIDLNINQASLHYDPDIFDLIDVQTALLDSGCSIPTREVVLEIKGMTCVSCLAHVEGTLQSLPGVMEAAVNLRQGSARVKYIPEVLTLARMCSAVLDAGYSAHLFDHEQKKRGEEKSQPYANHRTDEAAGIFGWVRKKFKG
jgi:Cu+-exporting ATPase